MRSIPEILAGQYPIGYDTINAYLPLMLDWRIGTVNLTDLAGGWFLPFILGSFQKYVNTDPVATIRFVGPISYGFLGWSQYLFAKNRLAWSNKKSFALVLLSSMYFTYLRLSWDLLRNVLGLAFGLIALSGAEKLKTKREIISFSSALFLAAASQVLVGFVVMAVLVLELCRTKAHRTRRIIMMMITPAIIQVTASIALLALSNFEGVGISGTLGTTRADTLYDFIPLVIPCVFGLSVLRKSPLASWAVLCGIATIAGLFPGPQRWALMLTVPFTIAATQGLAIMLSSPFRHLRVVRGLGLITIFVWLMLGSAYLTLPAQEAFPYFSHFTPTSMLQSSIPVSESENLVESFQWLSTHISSNAVLITHDAMYGWTREYFIANNKVMEYGGSTDFDQAVNHALDMGYTQIYTVWWVNGLGWYGYPNPPSGLELVHEFGDFGVFYHEGGT